jgi:DNA-binding transcriptional LysR family regulator
LAIDAVRWLDEIIIAPNIAFHSNSILAQCNAAAAGLGIVLLPSFVGSEAPALRRILPEISVLRNVWMSVRTEQSSLPRVKATQFLSYILQKIASFRSATPSTCLAAIPRTIPRYRRARKWVHVHRYDIRTRLPILPG